MSINKKLLFILLVALITLWLVPAAQSATPIYVRPAGNDTLCNGTVNVDYSPGVAPNCAVQTIQKGIDLVDSNGTVNVSTGTYNLISPIVANKSVTITGDTTAPANVIVNAPTSGSDRDCFQVRANNVTIQGFTLNNALSQASGDGYQNAGIMVGNDSSKTLMASPVEININGGNFSYNVMDNNGFGIYVYRSKNITVTHNEVKNSSTSGSGSPGNGIHMSKDPPTTYIMTGNTIEYNSAHNNGRYGIYLLGVSGSRIYGNTVENNTDYNVYMNSYMYGISFTGNTIGFSTSGYGLFIEDGLGGGTGAYPKNMVVNYNSFANPNGAVGVKHYYGTLNIKYNWWGTNAGPTVGTGNPPTSGNLRIWTGMSANYSPWLTSSNPDLLISKIYAPSRTSAGATISVKDMTWNKSADKASTFKTRFYLSADTILDGGDVSLGERSISELAGGTKSTGTTPVNIPSGTTPGMYFIIGKADADNVITESNENNNTKYRMITIGPDLQISSLIAPASASPGTNISITDTTRNNGAAEAILSTTKFYLSIDKPLDSDDTLLVSRSIPVLGVRESNTGTSTITIPSDTPPNMWYYIIGKADADSNITEYNENNNVRIKAIWIAQ